MKKAKWLIIISISALILIVVALSITFAWYTTSSRVSTNSLELSSRKYKEYEIATGGELVDSSYNGETGLGDIGTADAPYYVTKVVNITVPLSTNNNSTGATATSSQVKSMGVEITNLKITDMVCMYGERALLDSTLDESVKLEFSPCATLYSNIRISTESEVPLAESEKDLTLGDKVMPIPMAYYGQSVIIPLEIRIYFLNPDQLALPYDERTKAFEYSTYEYMKTQFSFEYVYDFQVKYELK